MPDDLDALLGDIEAKYANEPMVETTTAPEPEPTPAPAAAEPPAPAAAPPPATEPEVDESKWPEDYRNLITKLRNERKESEKRWGPYARSFERLQPAIAAQVMRFVNAIGEDDATLAEIVGDWAGQLGLTKAEQAKVEAKVEAAVEDDEPLTADRVKALLAEALSGHAAQRDAADRQRDQERARQDEAAAIRAHVTELGYDAAQDPVSHDNLYAQARRLREDAMRRGLGMSPIEALDQAHELLESWQAQRYSDWRDGKRRDAQRVPAPTGAGGTPVKDTTPTDLDQAHERFLSRMA